jgi:LmbE family N-acetylglucosaminyl deacetylase
MKAPGDINTLAAVAHGLGLPAPTPAAPALLVLAHPDDETVGAAALLPGMGGGRFVYLTDGAPRDLGDALAAGCATRADYARLRRGELLSALESIGIGPERIEFIDCIDHEASAHLAALVRWLEILIREHHPSVVFTHPYEGGHPDHDSAAFAVHIACRRIGESGDPVPAILEFTSYHIGSQGWTFGEFVPSSDSAVYEHALSERERRIKRQLIGCYASQRGVLRNLPLEVERFRRAPRYDFTVAPHAGTLLYETFGWSLTGAAWRSRAQAALDELGHEARIRPSLPDVPAEWNPEHAAVPIFQQ